MYTAEQVAREADLQEDRVADMLRDYATLLRERESAKAAVTDAIKKAALQLTYYGAEYAYHHMGWTIETIQDGCEEHFKSWLKQSELIEAVAPMLASARVPDGWQTIMQEKPAGATHYMVQPKWEHGQLMVGVRWFKPWKNGGYAEWCTDCDNEYPAFRVLNIPDLSPTSITAATKPEAEE